MRPFCWLWLPSTTTTTTTSITPYPSLNHCSAVLAQLDLPLSHCHLSMASLKNNYSLSQPSPAKAVCGHGTPFVAANEPNLHHYSLSHHPFVFSPSISKLCPICQHNHIFSLHLDDAYATSPIMFPCTCASMVLSNTSPHVWHQMSHLNSSLFSHSNPSLINSWWHVPSLRLFSLC